jgi:multisubunit Na+/H+ antiporter MnhC subunit
LEFWIWNFGFDFGLDMKSAVLLTKVVIGFWRFGFVLDFADMLTTMVIGFGVKFEHCLGLTNLKKFEEIWKCNGRVES